MRPGLAAIAARQGGLVTRRQAVEAADYSERELRSLTRVGGPWVVVRRGVYVERELWESADEHVGRMVMRDRAAELVMTMRHLLSHDSAARAHGMDLLRPRLPLVHVTRKGLGGGRTEHGVKHHYTREWLPAVTADGRRVTTVARTALDVAREHGFESGAVACDWAMAMGVSRAELARELEEMECFPYISAARAAVQFADPGAESIAETLGRILVHELGIGDVETQFPVSLDDGRVVWCDLRVGCHVFEVDGKVKYFRPQQGGIANRPAGEVVWDERTRQNLVCARGLGASRIIWDDFWGDSRRRARRRLADEYAVTVRRFGTELPEDLARFAREARARRRPRRWRPAS